MSSPDNTSAVTAPKPSEATDLISFIPLMPLRFSSIFRIMPSSISSGPAPGYATETFMRSSSISGKTSCFIAKAMINPPTMKTIIRRLAATWLWAIHLMGPFTVRPPLPRA